MICKAGKTFQLVHLCLYCLTELLRFWYIAGIPLPYVLIFVLTIIAACCLNSDATVKITKRSNKGLYTDSLYF